MQRSSDGATSHRLKLLHVSTLISSGKDVKICLLAYPISVEWCRSVKATLLLHRPDDENLEDQAGCIAQYYHVYLTREVVVSFAQA